MFISNSIICQFKATNKDKVCELLAIKEFKKRQVMKLKSLIYRILYLLFPKSFLIMLLIL